MGTVLVELPEELRGELKEPFGPIYTDIDGLVADAGAPIVAVGDVVTYHLLVADRRPEVALVDGKTKREAIDEELAETIGGFDRRIDVDNPAGTLTAGLLAALREALSTAGSTIIVVDGEEDLAALPAILAAPEGSAVVYGQPGEGMVLARADDSTRKRCRGLLERMTGDTERLWTALDVDG